MSVQQNLSAVVNNDLLFEFSITHGGHPADLSDYTVTVYLKATQTTSDDDATTFTSGDGLTMTFPAAGKFTWAVDAAGNAAAGALWYRVDVESGGDVATVMYGTLTVTAA